MITDIDLLFWAILYIKHFLKAVSKFLRYIHKSCMI